MRIDMHAHLWSEDYLDRLASYGRRDTAVQRDAGASTSRVDLDGRLALMDSAGVGHQVLSATPQSPEFPIEGHAVAAARQINDLYAETVRHWPDRFSALAALPLPHIDAALKELARALDDLGMVGAAVNSDILGRSLADPAFAPLYAELDRRQAILYVHPAGHDAGSALIRDHQMRWMVGAPLEDTVAAMHLILAGIPGRYPGMKIVISHLGGALPMLIRRAENQYRWESPSTPEPPMAAARRMYYDTVAHNHPPALRAAADTFGADRLVLGTDFPYLSGDLFRGAVSYVRRTLPEEAGQILEHTPATLLR